MAYVLVPDRVTLTIEDGPTVEVGSILAWPVVVLAGVKYAAYVSAKTSEASVVALRDLYEYFVAEAQPTWEVLDHQGPVLPTALGMLRLPLPIAFRIISGWLDTAEPKTTAADELLPDGPVKDAINLELRRKRRKAA